MINWMAQKSETDNIQSVVQTMSRFYRLTLSKGHDIVTIRDEVKMCEAYVEMFEHGKVLDFQVKWNRDYNPAPGRGIEKVCLEDIDIRTGGGEEPSVIAGYSDAFAVRDIVIRRMRRDGKEVRSLEEGNIYVGEFAEGVIVEMD